MATITVNVDDGVYERFRKIASEEKKGKKGFLGDTITEAMQKYATEKDKDEAAKKLLAMMKKGFNLGGLSKGFKREDLYERD